jgi:hypothetical protein
MKTNINNNNYNLAKKYYFCHLPCMHSLRNLKLVPNESLMNIINKFNNIKTKALLEKEDEKVDDNNNTMDNNNNNNIKNNDNELLSLNYDSNYVHLSYNFDKNRFYKLDEILKNINSINENKLKIEPKLVYNDGNFAHNCQMISQAKILEKLSQQYNILYNNDFDENNLNIEEIFNVCLNIDVFIKSSKEYKDKEYIIYSLQCIYNIYLNKMNKQKKE